MGSAEAEGHFGCTTCGTLFMVVSGLGCNKGKAKLLQWGERRTALGSQTLGSKGHREFGVMKDHRIKGHKMGKDIIQFWVSKKFFSFLSSCFHFVLFCFCSL